MMKYSTNKIFVLQLLLFSFIVLSSNCDGVEVKIKNGDILGMEERTKSGRLIYSFLGIPFAAPPVARLRFEDPQPAANWEGVRNATSFAEHCFQVGLKEILNEKPIQYYGNEDCLYLNVFTPQLEGHANQNQKSDKSLPVMVFIHGGAFLSGGSSLYGPTVLLEEDVVLVVIQYRLGLFGFLSTEDSVLGGNLGMKDQVMALRWVRDNIAQFNGDRDKVTIFGTSAGGASVSLHMLSPMSKGLFRAAITQSGTALSSWVRVRTHRVLATKIGEAFNCPITSQNYKECLKEKDALALTQEMYKHFTFGMAPLQTSPNVDGEFLLDEPEILLMKGEYSNVNVMSGDTREDGAYVSLMLYKKNSESIRRIQNASLNFRPASLFFQSEKEPEVLAEKVYDFYLKGKKIDISATGEVTRMFGHSYFSIPHDLTAQILLKNKNMKVFLYQFSYRGKNSFADLFSTPHELSKNWVVHYDDMFYLFNGGDLFKEVETENDNKMVKTMVKLWTNFAKTGNPTPPDESRIEIGCEWKAASEGTLDHLHIKQPLQMIKDQRREAREMWTSLDTYQNRLLFPKEKNSANLNNLSIHLTILLILLHFSLSTMVGFLPSLI